jgi:hypothetical protein
VEIDGWTDRERLTMTVQVGKANPAQTSTKTTGILRTTDDKGQPVLTRYTFDGTGWADPVNVDHNDKPIPVGTYPLPPGPVRSW